MSKLLEKIWAWLHEASEGRTAYRGIKTFIYTAVAGVALAFVAEVDPNTKMILGTAILSAIGFSADKGYRESKKSLPAPPEETTPPPVDTPSN